MLCDWPDPRLMKPLAACQTLETLVALERKRQADTNRRKVIRRVYSDTSPPSSFLHRRIHTNCNAETAKASSRYLMLAARLVWKYPPGKQIEPRLLLLFFGFARGAGCGAAQEQATAVSEG